MNRRTLATVTVAFSIAAIGFAPTASAQPPILNDFIATISCEVLENGLKTAGLVDENTTRNELATKLRKETHRLADFAFPLNIVAGQIADRAQACGFVKEDPQNPFSSSTQFLEIFDGLSSTLPKP